MDAAVVTEVCRLCPVNNTQLISVFDERFSGKNNIKEVILVTTGIEVLKNDVISVKICDRCLNITLKMFKFRQDAILQDKSLREKRNQLIGDQEIRLPNTEVRIKREIPSTSVKNTKRDLEVHNSITQMFKVFPTLKLPTICINQDMAPFISLPMGEVEKYFKDRKLNMNQYIWKSPAASMKSQSNRVAKKRVSVPTQYKKTVTPLKISKKKFKSHEKSNETSGSYFCTPVNEEETRKRSSSSGSGGKAKISRESIPGCSNNFSEGPVTPLRVALNHTPVDQSEESRDSMTSNKSRASSSSSNNEAYQNVHFESFDSNPSVARKSETQLVCHLCASVHNNASELKRHTLKHMVCQFCKRRFKSLENKNHHINNICVIKKVMNSAAPKVHLMKIDLDLETRKKYMDAFTTFEPIPGLLKPEEVFVRAASPPQSDHQNNIIVLSDDDNDVNADPLLGSLTAPEIISSVNTISYPIPEPVVFNSSIVRPDIKIKTNDVISQFFGNNNEKEVTKAILRRPNVVKISMEKMIQTDMPSSKDINIKLDATCEFKNLKEQIVPFKVPIHIINGPFNVAYKFDNPPKSANKSGAWNSLPVVEARKKSPKPQPVVPNSKPVASSSVPIQLPVILKNNNPQPSASQSNNAQAVNSPTPMLQTYFDRAPDAAVSRKSLPIPKTYLNKNSHSALKSMLTSNTPVSQSVNRHIGATKSVNTSISNAVLNNPTNTTTNQRPPTTMLGDMLDRLPSSTSLHMTEEIASNMKNLLVNTPHSNSPAKNSILHRRVSTNQVFVNNTTLNNSTNHVQNDVVPMSNGRTSNIQLGVSANSFAPNTTASSNNPAPIQNLPVSSPNQQTNVNYSSSVTPNTNVFTSPLPVSNTQRNLNPPVSLMPNAQTNVNPPRSLIPTTSATQNTQRNVPLLFPNRNALLMPNTQGNVNSAAMATRDTQRNVPAMAPHRTALLMPNTQRNSSYSLEPTRFRVKDIRELQ